MKILNFRLIRYLILITAASSIVACSPRVQQIKDAEFARVSSGPKLTNIEVTDSPSSTQILLTSEDALQYTSFNLSDPPRLIIDLSDVSGGEFKEPILVNKGLIRTIYPVEADDPNRVTRLDIRLTKDSIAYRIYRRENALIVDLPKETEDIFSEQVSIPSIVVQPQDMAAKEVNVPETDLNSQKSEDKDDKLKSKEMEVVIESKSIQNGEKTTEKQEGINVIRDIKIVSSDNKTDIVIIADKDIDAKTFTVEGYKIVIDVNNVKYPAAKEEMPAIDNNRFISKIRIGRHTTPVRKIRVVADLKEEATYDVSKDGNIFTLSIVPKVNGTSPEKVIAEGKNIPVNEAVAEPAEKKMSKPASVSRPIVALKYPGKKVSLDFQDADIINVLRLLAEVSKLNMVIGDNVAGKVTIKMLDVPWDQALDVILKMKGLGKVYEDNVLRIDTLSNIARQQEDEAKAKDAMVKAEDLVTQILPVNYAKAGDIAESIKKSLSSRGDITVDIRTNMLIIKDIKDKQEEIDKLLKTLDKPTPQVLIEARIVQADSNFAKDLGIQWGGSYTSTPGDYNVGIISGPGGSVGAPTTGFAVNLPAAGVAGTKGSVGFTIGKTIGDAFNLDLRLSAGETKGLTKVLSAPKIATLDNREATIQQGESIPYKTVSQTGTKTEFIDATLTLKVTPKVTPDGHIAMNIRISKNRQGSIVVEGTPSINKKEATTEVLVKDGETTVIGGIYEITDVDNVSGIPWFYQVPIFSWLFKSTQKSNIKSELLIFITPKIIPVNT
ncbi:MAG: hypothetical protein A2Z47_13980 [Thermodesulfovibrio sp. RBG_19FT_COMBO_42_12]|nr:MAG: hypothetical protein A2Z47_13980 [Thermodesulfovibrio sp. RBG_19FT_COMBO_42_12]